MQAKNSIKVAGQVVLLPVFTSKKLESMKGLETVREEALEMLA